MTEKLLLRQLKIHNPREIMQTNIIATFCIFPSGLRRGALFLLMQLSRHIPAVLARLLPDLATCRYNPSPPTPLAES